MKPAMARPMMWSPESPTKVRFRDTAQQFLTQRQQVTVIVLTSITAIGFAAVHATAIDVLVTGISILIAIYLAVMMYKAVLIWQSWLLRPAVSTSDDRGDEDVPTYTVLVPVYRETEVLGALIANLKHLDYPTEKLQLLLILEHDDGPMVEAVEHLVACGGLPRNFEVVTISNGGPRTKPNACNVGLAQATGEYVVIYDAEDRPDPDQLHKAVTAFRQVGPEVVCLQARLAYWNDNTNLVTRWFTAEYLMNFSLVLPGLTRLGMPVPLGGTSNHFRTDVLRRLGGWDKYNVTEDADLGMWIARAGLRVEMIDSVTMEEANSNVRNWIRQRSRWVKGYMQTWLVHMRHPVVSAAEMGIVRFISFNLVVGGTALTLLVNPLFWCLTVMYVVTRSRLIESLFPMGILYVGLVSLVVGNFLFLYYMLLACMHGAQGDGKLYSHVKWTLLVPLYWVMMSVAAYKALGQLLHPGKRYFWEKTRHGLVIEDPDGYPDLLGAWPIAEAAAEPLREAAM